MNRFHVFILLCSALPIFVHAQSGDKVKDIQNLYAELENLLALNINLKKELDSIKRNRTDLPKGYYLRLESPKPIKKAFSYTIMPSYIDNKKVYTIGKFRDDNYARSISMSIRSINLSNYKVIYLGDDSSVEYVFLKTSNTMWVED
ncbi:MAG: hypothetical protein JNL75_00520 [Chitinophagales bacterium]|nr:hypothetical protein [Chitinophagales bacterium]